MDQYDKAVALWQRRKISTDAELAEALNAVRYNSFAAFALRISNKVLKSPV